ncbi:hypothetical protein EDF60_1672 [Leucobacter luti]|nr:hypothetical protein [Leucobacter luti]TCK41246.1 hypothetical protein EDF60_1672 [Leucobacter luti]
MSTVEEIEYRGLPYRAVREQGAATDPERGIRWTCEYQALPDRFWRPRGYFFEKDGIFHLSGRTFDSANAALKFRARDGL